jgi:hypothetical protein
MRHSGFAGLFSAGASSMTTKVLAPIWSATHSAMLGFKWILTGGSIL